MNPFGKIRVFEAFKNRREPESVHVIADDFWRTLMILSVIGALVIVGFNLWEFTDVDHVVSNQTTTTVGASDRLPFDKNQLQAVIDAYAKRHDTYLLYASSTQAVTIADPAGVKKVKPTR